MTDAADAGWIIERIDGAAPMYFSAQIGRDLGAPWGGWTPVRNLATLYVAFGEANRILAGPLQVVGLLCKLTPVTVLVDGSYSVAIH